MDKRSSPARQNHFVGASGGCEKGKVVRIDGVVTRIKGDDAFIVPGGARQGDKPLRLCTTMGPRARNGIVRATKAGALAAEETGRRLSESNCNGQNQLTNYQKL